MLADSHPRTWVIAMAVDSPVRVFSTEETDDPVPRAWGALHKVPLLAGTGQRLRYSQGALV